MWTSQIFLVSLAALICSCQYKVVTPDAGPGPSDAAVPVGDVVCAYDPTPIPEPSAYLPDDAWCPLAQQTLQKLCCRDAYGRPMGAKNADGEQYAVVCKDLETKQGIPLNAKCQAKATSCEEAKKCTRAKP
jgi:hypothetical protein